MEKNIIVNILWVVAGICAFAVVYPYGVYPLVLRILPYRRVHSDDSHSDNGSEFALLFSAYNEANALPDKIANLRDLKMVYPDLELLAYDDCSTDGTADMLDTAALDIRVVRGSERAGKAHGMQLLASMTTREFLVFTDANVEIDSEALHHLHASYADLAVGGVCGVLQYVDVEGTPTASAGGLYWQLEELLKTLESRTGNVMGADGSIFSIRRSLYPAFPDTVLDDMTVSMAVVFGARRLVKDPLVIARECLVASREDDVRRRIRISMRSFHTHLWLRPQLRAMPIGDRWRWWSHRYLRWHGAHLLLLGYLIGLAAIGLSGHCMAAVVIMLATALIGAAGNYLQLGRLSTVVHLVASILMTGIGVIRAQKGVTMATWKPPTR